MELDHKHIILSAAVAKPTTDCEFVKDWLIRLIKAVGMKIKIGPLVEYVSVPGNEGITSVVCIETSHVAFHCWDKENPPFIKFDLYSCATFDVDVVIPFIMEFDPYFYKWILLDRNPGSDQKEIAKDKKQCKKVVELLDENTRRLYSEYRKYSRNKTHELKTNEHKKANLDYYKLKSLYSLSKKDSDANRKFSSRQIIAVIKSRAKLKNLDFDLTPEWYKSESEKSIKKYPKLILHPFGNTNNNFWAATVDRISPEKGYIQENCRIIPHALNSAKSHWNFDQLLELQKLISEDINPLSR